MKKKKLIFSIVAAIVILLVLAVVGIKYKDYFNNSRYETIRKEIDEEAIRYLKVTNPYCIPGGANFTINEETLLIQWAMDKNKLLDVDGKSYCKARIEVMCVGENELDTDVYIKCKDFEDKNYSNWEERYQFMGIILEVNDNSIIVELVEGTNERKSSDKIIIKRITNDNYVVGDKVRVTYNGLINESYPAQISVIEIELLKYKHR